MRIGTFRFTVDFSGTTSGWTVAELEALAAAIQNAVAGDGTVTAAKTGANGNYSFGATVYFTPGSDGPTHIGELGRIVDET